MAAKKPKKFKKKEIPNLQYGILHSQFGHADGVSIVMKQIERVMMEKMNIPKKNLHYLVGRSKEKGGHVTIKKEFWMKEPTNQLMVKRYQKGYGGDYSSEIEPALQHAQNIITDWIKKKNIEVIIAHNTCHPVNFIMSVALYRYYRDALKNNERTPKYILWWHDSHLERPHFKNPAPDVQQYLLDGVPGEFVEYILFINSLQFKDAEKYLLQLDEQRPGFFDGMCQNHTVMYNTADRFIDTYDELHSDKYAQRVEKFIEDFKVKELLEEHNVSLKETMFCLQHTRIVERKRIDFALEYCFELLQKLKKTKALYFLVSGHKDDDSKRKLKNLYRKLCKKYQKKLFLVFAEDYDSKTDIKFEEYPLIFAKLGGFATYFSEIEGFGNNLLEVMASGLIPVVYTYPVFKEDIAKQNFKVIALEDFAITDEALQNTIDVICNSRRKKIWVNKNLKVLSKRFSHDIISMKLKRAIIRERLHL